MLTIFEIEDAPKTLDSWNWQNPIDKWDDLV